MIAIHCMHLSIFSSADSNLNPGKSLIIKAINVSTCTHTHTQAHAHMQAHVHAHTQGVDTLVAGLEVTNLVGQSSHLKVLRV